jgi:hypothetical protein
MSKDEASDLKVLIDSRVLREIELVHATAAKNEAAWKVESFLITLQKENR